MVDLTGERVLVTGGAGFIGSHLAEVLLWSGARVTIVDDMSTGSIANLSHLRGREGLRIMEADAARVPAGAIRNVTMGVHLAARTEVAASVEDPAGTVEANVLGSVHVLEALHQVGATSAVVASSAAVYGEVPVPVDEAGPHMPISPYGAGKLAVDHFASYYARHTDLAVSSLRFFNVYGPRQHPMSPYSGVISIFSKAALAGEDLVVNGDGEQTRDFVYVTDVVGAVVSALAGPEGRGEAINVGTGKATTLNELARTVVSIADSASTVRHGPPRQGDIRHSVAKVDKAASLLRFTARTSLQEGLGTTVGWMRTQLQGAPDR